MTGTIATITGRDTLEQCVTCKRIFDRKLQVEKIILQKEGALNVHDMPFPNHNNERAKVHMLIMSTSESEAWNDVSMEPGGEPDLDRMAQWVQSMSKVNNFYDKMDFSLKQRLAITNAIIKLTDPLGSSGLAKNRSRRNNRFEENAVVFYADE